MNVWLVAENVPRAEYPLNNRTTEQESPLDLLVDLYEQGLSLGLVFENGHNRPEEFLRVECPIHLAPFALLVYAVASL